MRLLASERNRAKRSRRLLVLMLVESAGHLKAEDPVSTEEIRDAIAYATRDTDIIGWYRDGKIVGVIFTEIPLAETSDAGILSHKVNHALQTRLGATASELRLSFQVFSGDSERDADGRGASAAGTCQSDGKKASAIEAPSNMVLG